MVVEPEIHDINDDSKNTDNDLANNNNNKKKSNSSKNHHDDYYNNITRNHNRNNNNDNNNNNSNSYNNMNGNSNNNNVASGSSGGWALAYQGPSASPQKTPLVQLGSQLVLEEGASGLRLVRNGSYATIRRTKKSQYMYMYIYMDTYVKCIHVCVQAK